MKIKLKVLLCLMLVMAMSGCNHSNTYSKKELETISTHGGGVASFRLNNRVYTVDKDYAVAALNYQHRKYVLVINPDKELKAVPKDYTLAGKIKNSVLNDLLMEDVGTDSNAVLKEDYDTYFDSLLGCEVYTDPQNENFVYLKYDNRYILFVDYLGLSDSWIIYNEQLYLNQFAYAEMVKSNKTYYYDNSFSLTPDGYSLEDKVILPEDNKEIGYLKQNTAEGCFPKTDLASEYQVKDISRIKAFISSDRKVIYTIDDCTDCDYLVTYEKWYLIDHSYYSLSDN